MSSNATLYRCQRCGGMFPISEFESGERRGRVCSACRAKGNPNRKRTRKWDYVTALHKSVKIRVNRWDGSSRDRFGASFDEMTLRALFRAQQHRCMLTGVAFHLPTVEDLATCGNHGTGNHVSLDNWIEKMVTNAQDRMRVPELVRKCDMLPWTVSNTMLICRGMADYFEFCKQHRMTVPDMSRHLITMHETSTAPAEDAIVRITLEIQKEEEEGKFI